MQITETSTEGLKHEFKVVVGAADIAERIENRLRELSRQVRLPGFRPGKVPLALMRRRYGPAVMGEVLERAVNDGSAAAMREHKLRPALQPKVEIVSFNEGKDLEYKLAVEALPEFAPMNFGELRLERLKAEIPEEEVDGALERLAKRRRKTEAVDRPAQDGDLIVVDYTGKIGGEEFPGGSARGQRVELGAGGFIPGFAEQLAGAKPGEHRDITVTFPADYPAAELAGKEAVFAVDVKEVLQFLPQPIDDAFAQEMGMEDLKELRQTVREQIERDYAGVSRRLLKRRLLDQLAERHVFPVPQGMVDIEFDVIWKQFEQERERAKAAGVEGPEPGKSDDEVKAEYRSIAERRVRLGLLLSEVARNANITVSQEDLNRAVVEQMRRFPGQSREIVDFYRKQEGALDQLRAPILEDKVVDYILEMAQTSERVVPVSELVAAEEEDETKAA